MCLVTGSCVRYKRVAARLMLPVAATVRKLSSCVPFSYIIEPVFSWSSSSGRGRFKAVAEDKLEARASTIVNTNS